MKQLKMPDNTPMPVLRETLRRHGYQDDWSFSGSVRRSVSAHRGDTLVLEVYCNVSEPFTFGD